MVFGVDLDKYNSYNFFTTPDGFVFPSVISSPGDVLRLESRENKDFPNAYVII
jgi:hypothetical protein